MKEETFVAQIRQLGGRVFIVGGWVRDFLRRKEPKDKDYVICGLTAEQLTGVFPTMRSVGRSFQVYLLSIDGSVCEIALARRERKTGVGYRGFAVEATAGITIEEDLSRRDTTMNSMAWELPERVLIDPFNGQRDIRHRQIQAISAHFMDDPVRALRAARQAAEFSFQITEDTFQLMAACSEELRQEPAERIFGELDRVLCRAAQPSVFFRSLQTAKLLSVLFPELYALIGKIQPAVFHPEGDAFEHTMHIVDLVAARTTHPETRFAALAHDLGKGTTPAAMLPHHYDHEQRGLIELRKWNQRSPLPKRWRQLAEFIIREHMRAPRLTKSSKIVQLLLAMDRLPFASEEILVILQADHGSLPEYLLQYSYYLDALKAVSGMDAPAGVHGEAVGIWLFRQQLQAYLRAAKKNRSGIVSR